LTLKECKAFLFFPLNEVYAWNAWLTSGWGEESSSFRCKLLMFFRDIGENDLLPQNLPNVLKAAPSCLHSRRAVRSSRTGSFSEDNLKEPELFRFKLPILQCCTRIPPSDTALLMPGSPPFWLCHCRSVGSFGRPCVACQIFLKQAGETLCEGCTFSTERRADEGVGMSYKKQ